MKLKLIRWTHLLNFLRKEKGMTTQTLVIWSLVWILFLMIPAWLICDWIESGMLKHPTAWRLVVALLLLLMPSPLFYLHHKEKKEKKTP